MARRFLGVVLCAGVIALSGCAGTYDDPNAPPAPDDIAGWARRFPESRWTTAWGTSSESARDADLDARAQVSARVRSSIRAETTSLARAVMRNEDVNDFQELISEVTTTTEFSRAELIRAVDASAHHEDGQYRVLAVLDRHELASILQADYDEAAVSWRSVGIALDDARGDLPAWTAAWHRYRGEFAGVVAVAGEIRGTTGLNPDGYRSDQARWRSAHADRDSVLGNLDLVLVLAPVEGLDIAELSERLAAGFAQLGVTARGGRCGAGAATLRLEPQLTWTTVIGKVVSLELRGTIGPCAGDEVWSEVVIAGSALRGDGRDPTGDLLESMTAEELGPLLEESLGHVVPF